MGKRVLLSDFRKKQEEEKGLEIEGDGGTVFRVPPPALWPDEVYAVSQDPRAIARLVLGDQYDQFIAEGGSALLLAQIVQEEHGVSLGE